MKKLFFSLLLLIIVLMILSFVVIFLSFNFLTPRNPINSSLRKTFIKNIYLRNIFKLQRIGDAKYDFISNPHFKKLTIDIIDFGDENLSEKTKNSLSLELNKIINKPEGITITEKDDIWNFNNEIDDNDIKKIISKYKNSDNNSIKLIIFIFKKYLSHPTYAGLVKDSNHLFIFTDPIRDISYYEKGTEKAEISTILHEFAHLLGAKHVYDENCILSEKVENTNLGTPKELITSFCQKDLDEINKETSF